jgi:hypothetical protein
LPGLRAADGPGWPAWRPDENYVRQQRLVDMLIGEQLPRTC